MQIPLQITLRGIDQSDALQAAIRERAAKLEHIERHIISCRVIVELPGAHKHKGKEFVVRIDLKVPGAEIAVNRDHSEDVYVALHDAFDAARRKLEDHARRQRAGGTEMHTPSDAD